MWDWVWIVCAVPGCLVVLGPEMAIPTAFVAVTLKKYVSAPFNPEISHEDDDAVQVSPVASEVALL